MFESDNVTHSIYQLIEEACIVLMNFSFTLKTHDGSMPVHRAVYYRMLWSKCSKKKPLSKITNSLMLIALIELILLVIDPVFRLFLHIRITRILSQLFNVIM